VGVSDVSEPREQGFEVRRLWMPSSGVESWTVIGRDLAPVVVVDEFLAWLTQIERSPNTVEAYARDLNSAADGRPARRPSAEWHG
jgi:integrase/recombinase XerD